MSVMGSARLNRTFPVLPFGRALSQFVMKKWYWVKNQNKISKNIQMMNISTSNSVFSQIVQKSAAHKMGAKIEFFLKLCTIE